jgi:hypothetical protein
VTPAPQNKAATANRIGALQLLPAPVGQNEPSLAIALGPMQKPANAFLLERDPHWIGRHGRLLCKSGGCWNQQ